MVMLRKLEKVLFRWFLPSSSGLHLDLLDGMRGLAILLVVAAHGLYFNPEGPKWLITIGQFVGSGWVGVPVFFVLSGFLISYPFFRARASNPNFWYPTGYATRRILKVFPPFYLAILLLALYYCWHYGDSSYIKLGLQWAVGIPHFVYLPQYFNTSFWSLWVELSFYLLLPCLFFALRGRGIKTIGWLLLLGFLLVPAVTRFITWPANASPGEISFIVRRFPSCLNNFAWGVFFAAFYTMRSKNIEVHRHLARWGYLGLGLLPLSMGLMPLFSPQDSNVPPTRLFIELGNLLPGLSAFLMLFFVFNTQTFGARLFASPVLRYVGLISYEWFLFHQPAQFQFREWIGSTQGNLLLYAFTVGVPTVGTFILAALIYHTFSLPLMRWGRARIQSRNNKTSSLGGAVVAEKVNSLEARVGADPS